jgi:hypothetical protein
MVCLLAALMLGMSLVASAVAAQVTGQVSVSAPNGTSRTDRDVSVVLWLTLVAAQATSHPSGLIASPHPRLVQRNKVFDPHVRDPFFHNVFSLFNGKRFDLGLYEAGSTRSVHFDRAGVCYIFCNIHPQMSAVVVVVDTPYFAVSNARGVFTIPQVPAGRYRLDFWEEHCSAKSLQELSRQISVDEDTMSLGGIHVQESHEPVTAHLNKYGKQYDPDVFSSPLYVQP